MNKKHICRRIVSLLFTAFLAVMLVVPSVSPVSAANTKQRYITELRVESGEGAIDKLEKDGWSVMMVGLNITSDAEKQVYLAYKTNTGDPITNIVVSSDEGNTVTDSDGIKYSCVSHTDVDKGLGGKSGCIYATRDKHAGNPIVGIDVLRASAAEKDTLYPITNDGAEIVRTPKGTPADLESNSEKSVVYLAQIRDGIVRPYISEVGIVTDKDKWNAVYTACERGYNYYVEGDIDNSPDTYTIIVYERTADPKKAVTNITAVSEKTVKELEKSQIVDEASKKSKNVTAAAVSISGAEYVRISSKPVKAKESYYIYRTKDSDAGNPISMLYAEKTKEAQNFLLGTWANAYFFSPGATTAYTYSMNEDLYETLWQDQTVCTKIPVRLLNSFAQSATAAEEIKVVEKEETTTQSSQEETTANADEADAESEAEDAGEESEGSTEPATQEQKEETTKETTTKETTTKEETTAEPEEENSDSAKYIKLTMLTARDGLPEEAFRLTGMRNESSDSPYVERTQRSERSNKFQASVFGKQGGVALVAGIAVIAAAFALVIYKKIIVKKKSVKVEGTP